VSYIEGIESLKRDLRSFDDLVALDIEDGVLIEARAMQEETAELVPVDSGQGRDALLDPQALRVVKSPDGIGKRVIFGLDLPVLKKRAFHLFFIEFGTKGYKKGEQRKAGRKKLSAWWRQVSSRKPRDDTRFNYREVTDPKTGKVRLEAQLTDPQRWQTMKRYVPARPATPFWRPAEDNMWRRLETRLNLGRIVAAAKMATGIGRGH